ncbi:MAG: hypothetical protein WC641_01485 [Patescibacteria group bacterium]
MPIRTSKHSFKDFPARQPGSKLYRNIALSFLAVVMLVVIGVLWVSSVRARVTIKTKKDTTQVQTYVEVARSPEAGQLGGKVVKGNFEKIQEFAVKDVGSEEVPIDSEVSGMVKIINNYSKSQTLVKTTRLLTADGRLYRIDNTVTVGSKESVTVSAHSDKKGREYVMPVGTHLTIPGLWIDLQKSIYAETVSGFSGGSQTSKIVSSLQVADAQKVLEEAVFEQAQKTLKAEAGAADDWAGVYSKRLVEKKTNITPGQSSDQFLASVKMEVTAVYYPAKDMEVLLKQKLKERIPDGRDINYDASLVNFKIEQADTTAGKARLLIQAQASTRLTADSSAISKDAIAGLSSDDAKTKLMSVDGVESVDIQIRPTWIHTVPKMKDHIDLVVE